MAHFLVTGGAGYIGSVVALRLLERQHRVTILDNLLTGHREAASGELVVGDLANRTLLDQLLADKRFDGVFHFASHCYVGESVTNPRKYYEDNLVNALSLLGAMVDRGVRSIVFSSSCATYGVPSQVPIRESHPQAPINPYGATKLMIEQVLRDYGPAYGVRSMCLRYFNAAGASLDGSLGESHHPETHLIPLALRATRGDFELDIFGDDYPTPDGTCIRDYVHVEDLASAHIAAMERLLEGAPSNAYNLGTGHGSSVREVVAMAARVSGKPVRFRMSPRRPGDPPELVADASRANTELGWTPRHSDLQTILSTAWRWFQAPRY